MSDLRTVVQDHWAALAAARREPGWLTSAVPVETAGRSVLCALAPDGKRHLLVPQAPGSRVRPDMRAAAVHLLPLILEADGEPVHYADLGLLREDLADIFTGLCADVIAALATTPPDAMVVVSQVLDGWHALLRSGSQLGIEQLAGIFGELTVLNSLLDLHADLLMSWRGPLRSPQDFVRGPWAIEVKTTVSTEGRAVRIHGIDQLATSPSGGLMLWWMRLDTSSTGGTSVPEIVESTSRRVARPQELWQLLARSDYYTADAQRYGGARFEIVEEARYRVTDTFPRIVCASFPESLPPGVSDVRLTVTKPFFRRRRGDP